MIQGMGVQCAQVIRRMVHGTAWGTATASIPNAAKFVWLIRRPMRQKGYILVIIHVIPAEERDLRVKFARISKG